MLVQFREKMQLWAGRPFVQGLVENKGFGVHRCYQDAVLEFCEKRGLPCDVDVYWNAMSDEYIRSCVLVQSNRRLFYATPAYRSNYLDKLAEEADGRVSVRRFPSLHPCLFELEEEDEKKGLIFIRNVNAFAKSRKLEDIQRLKINEGRWDGGIEGLKKCTDEAATALGFERTDPRIWDASLQKHGYFKAVDNGLIFYFGFEDPKRNMSISQLPLRFAITHKIEPPRPIYLDHFESIVPGYSYYGIYNSPETAILGIRALLHLFKAMIKSFD